VAANQRTAGEFESLSETLQEGELLKERRWKDRADSARYTFWCGSALIAAFVIPLINVVPIQIKDPAWQLNLIGTLLNHGIWALLGVLLICLARLLNHNDRMIRDRALFMRTVASWLALGWLLLIPLQLFISVRLVNATNAAEIGEIQTLQRVSRQVSGANTEDELRLAVSRIPNQPPMPRLTVPVEMAKTNLLGQLQRNLNAAKNIQEQRSSKRWQSWLRDSMRNSLQCVILATGFLAIAKKRNIPLPS
jgi:hypothetical protein